VDAAVLQALREAAYREGFAKGEADGFKAAEEKAQAAAEEALQERIKSLEVLMQSLFEPIAQQDRQIEELLLDLLQRLARAVIRRELCIDSSQILPHLREALSLLPMGANNLHLFVSAQDFASIKALRDQHNEHWRICEDPDLLPGGFRLESEQSRIDASIESRLQQALSQLAEQQREQRLHPPAADIREPLSLLPLTAEPAQAQAATDKTSTSPATADNSPRPPAGEGPGEREKSAERAADGA